ncbi:MAG: site-2 protease family protein [Ignavibacteria bacterium]
MNNYNPDTLQYGFSKQSVFHKLRHSWLVNLLLFLLTFFTTTLAGVFWLNQDPYQLNNFFSGIEYSVLILAVITTHEFGHYFAARYHKVDVTLPFYIPFPFLELNPFGTMGAIIRMKTPANQRKALFDIGVAGPIAGWITTMIILIIGVIKLPSINYIYQIHPEYVNQGIPLTGLTFGNNIIFWALQHLVPISQAAFFPPMNEVYHYPFLCVGWFGLLITSLNLMPIGQLDGGHIAYAMFGEKHKKIAYGIFYLLLLFGLLGLLPLVGINLKIGSANWLVWALLIFFVIKVQHPPVCNDFDTPLGTFRTFLGWFAFIIFVISFCPIPILDV